MCFKKFKQPFFFFFFFSWRKTLAGNRTTTTLDPSKKRFTSFIEHDEGGGKVSRQPIKTGIRCQKGDEGEKQAVEKGVKATGRNHAVYSTYQNFYFASRWSNEHVSKTCPDFPFFSTEPKVESIRMLLDLSLRFVLKRMIIIISKRLWYSFSFWLSGLIRDSTDNCNLNCNFE